MRPQFMIGYESRFGWAWWTGSAPPSSVTHTREPTRDELYLIEKINAGRDTAIDRSKLRLLLRMAPRPSVGGTVIGNYTDPVDFPPPSEW